MLLFLGKKEQRLLGNRRNSGPSLSFQSLKNPEVLQNQSAPSVHVGLSWEVGPGMGQSGYGCVSKRAGCEDAGFSTSSTRSLSDMETTSPL